MPQIDIFNFLSFSNVPDLLVWVKRELGHIMQISLHYLSCQDGVKREREKKKVLKYGADFQRTKFHMGLTKSECEWIRMMKLNLFRLGEANCPLSTSIFLLFGIPPPTTALTASRSLFGKIRQEVFCVQTVNIYLSQCRLWILRKASYCKSSLITTSYSILQYDCYHYYYWRTEQFYILNWIDQGDSVTKKKQTLEYARYGPM